MSSAIRAILAVATNFETVLNAARLLALNGDILFVFIGGGYYVGALKSNVETEGLGIAFGSYRATVGRAQILIIRQRAQNVTASKHSS